MPRSAKGYHDEYRARVLKLIPDKAKGKEVVTKEAPKLAAVTDIIETLRPSIEATKKGTRRRAVKKVTSETPTRTVRRRRRRSRTKQKLRTSTALR